MVELRKATDYERIGFSNFKTEDLYLMAVLSLKGIKPVKLRYNSKNIISAFYEATKQSDLWVDRFYHNKVKIDALELKNERIRIKVLAKGTDNLYKFEQ